jgi:hypothetical protein
MASNITVVYTFCMPTMIYVQMKNIEKPAKVEADKVENDGKNVRLILKKGDETVGDIDANHVIGWWKQFE